MLELNHVNHTNTCSYRYSDVDDAMLIQACLSYIGNMYTLTAGLVGQFGAPGINVKINSKETGL